MKLTKKLTKRLIACLVCIAIPTLAAATPYTVNFSGSLDSALPVFNGSILDSYPIGTAVSFTATFDENFYTNGMPTRGYNSVASGSMQVGSSTYLFDSSIQWWTGNSRGIDGFAVQMTGLGPRTTDGGELYGLIFEFNPDVTLASAPIFGLQYLNPLGGGYFSYANLQGTISVAPASASVPEPATAMLLFPALALMWRTRRRQSAAC